MKEVKVYELPKCDFCSELARYDGQTLQGMWAYLCPAHFERYGIGLGMGRGQKLTLVAEKSSEKKEEK